MTIKLQASARIQNIQSFAVQYLICRAGVAPRILKRLPADHLE